MGINVNSNSSMNSQEIFKYLDSLDGKQDNKIQAETWNNFANQVGGKNIKNYIEQGNAINSIETYIKRGGLTNDNNPVNSLISGSDVDDNDYDFCDYGENTPEEIQGYIETNNQTIEQLSGDNEGLSSQMENIQNNILPDREGALDELQTELNSIPEQIQTVDSEMNDALEKLKSDLDRQLAPLNNDLAPLQEKLGKPDTEVSPTEKAEIKNDIAEIQKQIDQIKQEYEQNVETTKEPYNQQKEEIEARKKQLEEAEIPAVKQEIQGLNDDMNTLSGQIEQNQVEIDRLTNENTQYQNYLDSIPNNPNGSAPLNIETAEPYKEAGTVPPEYTDDDSFDYSKLSSLGSTSSSTSNTTGTTLTTEPKDTTPKTDNDSSSQAKKVFNSKEEFLEAYRSGADVTGAQYKVGDDVYDGDQTIKTLKQNRAEALAIGASTEYEDKALGIKKPETSPASREINGKGIKGSYSFKEKDDGGYAIKQDYQIYTYENQASQAFRNGLNMTTIKQDDEGNYTYRGVKGKTYNILSMKVDNKSQQIAGYTAIYQDLQNRQSQGIELSSGEQKFMTDYNNLLKDSGLQMNSNGELEDIPAKKSKSRLKLFKK